MQHLYRYVQVVLVLFGIASVTLFIQHHIELRDSNTILTSSQVFYPINGRGERTTKEEFNKYLINVRLSDDIPVNRDIPDSRPDSCKDQEISQLTVSIVITFYNEWPSILLRTVYSIINRTSNLKQIILVDDGNNDLRLDDLLQHIYTIFGDVIYLVTLGKRLGLIGARLEGVKHVTGDVLCFLDSHMEVNRNWLVPLLKVLEERPKAVAMSQLDTIQSDTLKYQYSKIYRTRYGFDWNLQVFETEYRQDQLRHGDLILPGVIAVGSAFAIRTDFFRDIGMYDPGLKIWGGENLELSFKVWLCGGELVHVTCSRIGHITRSQPYLQENRLDIEMFNYKRVVKVWMDEYIAYVYDNYPSMKKMKVGNLIRQQKERRKHCKPFSWFMDNIWPELFRYRDKNITSGSIVNTFSGTDLCLDNQNHLFSSRQRLAVKPCNKDPNSQMFGITGSGRLQTNLQCVIVKKEVFDFIPYIQNCLEPPFDLFIFKKSGEIVYKQMNLCLTLVASGLVYDKCIQTNSQRWKIIPFQLQLNL